MNGEKKRPAMCLRNFLEIRPGRNENVNNANKKAKTINKNPRWTKRVKWQNKSLKYSAKLRKIIEQKP